MHRQGYLQASVRTVAADLGCDGRVAADVGAGPGNPTGPLMAVPGQGWSTAGIDPGRDTRRVLSRRFAPTPQDRVPDATAKVVLLPAGLAGLILACTACHGFGRAGFFREGARPCTGRRGRPAAQPPQKSSG